MASKEDIKLEQEYQAALKISQSAVASMQADIEATLKRIKERGAKAGIVFNPKTEASSIKPYLPNVDLVLAMTVQPGFGGQAFIPSTLEKLRRTKQMITDRGLNTRIEIDGGVKVDNIRQIAEAGADMFVAGSAIFNQPDYSKVIADMRQQLALIDQI